MDISVVVTAHAEGRLAHRTMRSVEAAVHAATESGIRCEVIAMLDAPTDATREYFAESPINMDRLVEVDFEDPGLVRNEGTRLAHGGFVAFLDADDLFGRRWLQRSYDITAEHPGASLVVVPSDVIVFEEVTLWSAQIDSTDPRFRPETLTEFNYWTSVLFLTPRQLALDCPFVATPREAGFGFEDWHWFTQVLSQGARVVPAAETCVFSRRKRSASRLIEHTGGDAVLPPSPYFLPESLGGNGRWIVGQERERRTSIERHRQISRDKALRVNGQSWDECLVRMGHGLARRFPSCMPILVSAYRVLRRLQEWGGKCPQLPAWLRHELREMHSIEPQLYPDENFLSKLDQYFVPRSVMGEVYSMVCRNLESPVSHVLLVPWLQTGGADLEVLNYARAIANDADSEGLVVIATDVAKSPWACHLPKSAVFLELNTVARHLNADGRQKLVATLLTQLRPRVIHNLNSRLGYEVFERYGAALRRLSRLYVSTFCIDITPEGRRAGYPVETIPQCFDALTAVFADNRHVLESLTDIFGLDSRKLHVHYQPISVREDDSPTCCSDKNHLDVLWAGRLDRQKRPDILVEIAQRVQDLPIHFHVYGTSVLTLDRADVSFRGHPNVTYHGPFDGFGSLPVHNFDLLLSTSEWEGLPNLLLEALAHRLPVLTSLVGGIGELVSHDETGFLVAPFDNIDRYVEELRAIFGDRERLQRVSHKGFERVLERHTWNHFVDELSEAPGYLCEKRHEAEKYERVKHTQAMQEFQ